MATGLHLPRVIGHRGAARRAPENTLASFRKAAELGCEWVEFDVRLSGDDQPVVFHDDTLERTTDGSGAVGATPLGDLLRLDAGSYFGPEFRGEPIPTLEQALAVLTELGLGFDLELKAEAGREAALVAAVADVVERFPVNRSKVLVTSFSWVAISAFANAVPQLQRGFLTEAVPPDWRERIEALGAIAIICDHTQTKPEMVREARKTGLSWLTYTVNTPARARELFAWGVDGVFSDVPDAILASISPG